MPPPGGPQAPPPQDGAPPGGGAGQPQGGGIAALMANVDKAIDHIMQVIAQSPSASPQEKQLIQVVDQAFGKLMESVSGGTEANEPDEDSGPGAQGQTVSPEAGGNRGAIPSQM